MVSNFYDHITPSGVFKYEIIMNMHALGMGQPKVCNIYRRQPFELFPKRGHYAKGPFIKDVINRGGRGCQKSQKIDDVFYERPQTTRETVATGVSEKFHKKPLPGKSSKFGRR